MESKENVISFYNEYVQEQAQIGINDRIYSLYQRIEGLGINANSNILELGCGIGVLSYLLSKRISSGKIEAIDISDASIAFAKSKINSKNILFKTQDIVEFTTNLSNIHFITLFDVLEHIPLEMHQRLFCRIAQCMDQNSFFLINLPNPDFIALDVQNQEDSLQIIDQAVPLVPMLAQLEAAELELMDYEKYSIWFKDEYQFFIIRKKRPFVQVPIDSELSFLSKFKRKWFRLRIKQKNRFLH